MARKGPSAGFFTNPSHSMPAKAFFIAVLQVSILCCASSWPGLTTQAGTPRASHRACQGASFVIPWSTSTSNPLSSRKIPAASPQKLHKEAQKKRFLHTCTPVMANLRRDDEEPITLYLSPELAVIDKPWGVRMDGDFDMTVEKLVQQIYPGKARFIHQLDFATSGVLMLGLTKGMTSRIHDDFEAGNVEKEYMALLEGWLSEEETTVDAPICRYEGPVELPLRGAPGEIVIYMMEYVIFFYV
jgi:23S rRNA-/tRNA-specific pseudouridylate synthase